MEDRLRDGRRRTLSEDPRRRFVLAETRLVPVPFVPEIRLYQADEATALWQRTEQELAAEGLPPPFWAFAWAGGRGLARFLLDHREIVAGRRVLDFASGSGLVAIAAAIAGAAKVEAADIDPFAKAAIALNAAANDVAIRVSAGDCLGQPTDAELVLCGDIFYDRGFTIAALPWLRRLARKAEVLVGDPGRAYCPKEGVAPLASFDVPVEAALEEGASKRVTIWKIEP